MRREEYVHFFFCVKLPGSFMSFFFLDGFVDWIPPPPVAMFKVTEGAPCCETDNASVSIL
jgi:hypothetical protein